MTLIAKLEARRSQLKAQRRNPFTLLELLVVVAIIAIIAGAIISSYDGLDDTAAASTSSHTTASCDQIIRQYTVINNTAPNKFDSGLDSAGAILDLLPNTTLFTINTLSATTAAPLTVAGITALKATAYTNGATAPNTPNRVYDGSTTDISIASNTKVLQLNTATFNSKFGFGATEILVALPIGNNCTLVTNTSSKVTLGQAPASPDALKTKYCRYFAIYDIGTSTTPLANAKFLGMIDANGKTIDELAVAAKAN